MFTRFIVLSCLLVVAIYLFVTAPAPLPDIESQPRRVPILSAFSVLAAENNVVRALWTDEFVAKGKTEKTNKKMETKTRGIFFN